MSVCSTIAWPTHVAITLLQNANPHPGFRTSINHPGISTRPAETPCNNRTAAHRHADRASLTIVTLSVPAARCQLHQYPSRRSAARFTQHTATASTIQVRSSTPVVSEGTPSPTPGLSWRLPSSSHPRQPSTLVLGSFQQPSQRGGAAAESTRKMPTDAAVQLVLLCSSWNLDALAAASDQGACCRGIPQQQQMWLAC